MTELNYFQTYSQRENHVTNNTLLMLRHVYRSSPKLMDELLAQLLEMDDLEVGLQFAQQKPIEGQVPDAFLKQAPLEIYIEAKRAGNIDDAQIWRHLQAIGSSKDEKDRLVLVGLAAHAVSADRVKRWQSRADEHNVRVAATTYDALIECLQGVCKFDRRLLEILADYEAFIDDEGLRPNQHRHVVAVLCGATHKDNVRTRIYYEPDERAPKWRRAHIMGIYHNKRISHIGRIEAVVVASYRHNQLVVSDAEYRDIPQDATARIEGAIEAAEKHYPGIGRLSRRYYFMSEAARTDFRKSTPGGLMGHRYFDLGDFLKGRRLTAETPIGEIAEALKGLTFR